jgi:23S rRNA (pseudouridine1915-N3)-methyltransferase
MRRASQSSAERAGRASVRISIIAVGKIKQAGLRAELDDYLGRIRRYASCDEIELKDGSDAELQQRFAKAIPKRAHTIALEVEGRSLSSQGLAELVQRGELAATPLVFLIGGAYGLPAAVSSAAHTRLSLSAMTLPHRLARVVLAEQVYRAFTILRNEPYSH